MSQKRKNKNKKYKPIIEKNENILPQNILPMGEHVEENKNIYIAQSVYKKIHNFTQNKTTNESGGMLVGDIVDEFGKTNVIISGFIEAKYCEATPTTLKFTHETWDYVHKEIDKKFSSKKILGWIHTHPDFGIFLSEYDKFIHEKFFNEEYQIAYVVDPIQNIEGFYFWINGKIERCKGFYIYDKTGNQISDFNGKEKIASEDKEKSGAFSVKNIIIALLTVAVIYLIFSNLSIKGKLATLEEKCNDIDAYNQTFMYFQQRYNSLQNELNTLKKSLGPADDISKEDEKQDTDDNKKVDKNASNESVTSEAQNANDKSNVKGKNKNE